MPDEKIEKTKCVGIARTLGDFRRITQGMNDEVILRDPDNYSLELQLGWINEQAALFVE